MKDHGPRIPDFGRNFLRTGSSVIHFYYSPAEQLRFGGFLNEGLRISQGVVLAAPAEVQARFAPLVRLPRFRRRGKGELQQVVLTADLNAGLRLLVQAVRDEISRCGRVRLLADFAGLVTQDEIFEVEADLSSSLQHLPTTCVTQYDGAAVPAPVTVEQFKTHSLAIVGDAFYYENQHVIPPEQYFRKRRGALARAAGR